MTKHYRDALTGHRLDKLEGWPGQKPLDGEAELLAGMLDGRCLSDITHRDKDHRQSFCMLPAEHAPLAHDDCMGCTWTDADHWQPSAVDRLADQIEAVREWIDRRGVNVGDRDDDYMRGYRDAQRHAVQDAAELRATLDGAES